MGIQKTVQEKINLIQPDSLFFSDINWGSDNFSGRDLIRKSIATQFHDQIEPDILNLNKIPSLIAGHISISHCASIGSYIFSPTAVGLDIEESQRIKLSVVARVSNTEELLKAPSPELHWCAKEAAFKFLISFEQPKAISEIILDWTSKKNDVYYFQIESILEKNFLSKHIGFAFYAEKYSVAIVLAN